jgi:hypothetical protein
MRRCRRLRLYDPQSALLASAGGRGRTAALLERQPRSLPGRRKLDGAQHARLVALACSKAPPGAARWTLRCCWALVELQVVDSISYETVRRAPKKTTSSRDGR